MSNMKDRMTALSIRVVRMPSGKTALRALIVSKTPQISACFNKSKKLNFESFVNFGIVSADRKLTT